MKKIKNRHILVIGAASSVKTYQDKIHQFIREYNVLTIGINYMTSIIYPDYHLWTNKQRYRDQGSCINTEKSKMLFGCGLPKKLIRKHHKGKYITINYIDEDGYDTDYRKGVIRGRFRTAGVLSIMIAHINGASSISVVGMDGFTLYSRKALLREKKSHHCYGKGYTDDASWDKCKKKDAIVNDALHNLKDYGINFQILTPTKFKDFYNPEILAKF